MSKKQRHKPVEAVASQTKPVAATSVLPDRGTEGMIGAVIAGLASGGLSWLSLKYGGGGTLLLGFVFLAPLPLFAVGLAIGRSDVIVAAAVAVGSMMYFLDIQHMAVLALVFVLPALMLCLLALRYRQDDAGKVFWYPAGRLIMALVLYPIALLAILCLIFHDPGLQKVIASHLQPLVEQMMQYPKLQQQFNVLMPPDKQTPEMIQGAVLQAAGTVPSVLMMIWLPFILINALWTHFVLLSNGHALRPIPKLDEFDLPPALLIFFAIMIVLAVAFEGSVAFFAKNTLLLLAIPYFVLGASLFHLWAGKKRHKILLLVFFYAFLMVPPYVFTGLVAMAGVLEPWLHLRQRIAGTYKAKN